MQPKIRVTRTGEEHGLINVVANSVTEDKNKVKMSPETRAKAEKQEKHDAMVVAARYLNHRGQHERLTKPYMKQAGEPIQIWHLIPGEVYELPLGFIEEVNQCYLAQRSEVLDKDGIPTKKDGPGERIHELVPVSFVEVDKAS